LFSLRLISLLSTLGILALIFSIVKKKTANISVSILASFLFLTHFANGWFYVARVDLLATFFALFSLYFFFDGNKRYNYPLSFLFIILAVLTKQTAIVLLFTYLAIFLIHKEYSNFVIYGLLSCGAIGGFSIFLDFLTDGRFLQSVLIESLSHKLDFNRFILIKRFVRVHSLLFVAAAYAIFIGHKDRKFRKEIIVFTASFLSACLFILKPGSNINYFITTFILLIIIGSETISKLINDKKTKIFIFSLILALMVGEAQQAYNSMKLVMRKKDAYNKILNYVMDEEKLVIFEGHQSLGVHSSQMGILGSFDYLQRLKLGRWDSRILIEGCRRHEYSIVGTGWRIRQYRKFMDCLDKKYVKLDEKYLGVDIYLPPDKVEKFRRYMKYKLPLRRG